MKKNKMKLIDGIERMKFEMGLRKSLKIQLEIGFGKGFLLFDQIEDFMTGTYLYGISSRDWDSVEIFDMTTDVKQKLREAARGH